MICLNNVISNCRVFLVLNDNVLNEISKKRQAYTQSYLMARSILVLGMNLFIYIDDHAINSAKQI